jgi:hypothetical protein
MISDEYIFQNLSATETKTTNYHNEQSPATSSNLAVGEEEDWYHGSTRTSSNLKIDLLKSKRAILHCLK